MMISNDEGENAREMREAVAMLEPPALSSDVFARIAERRARGERIVLRTVDMAPLDRRSRLAAIALAAAAATIVAGLLFRHDARLGFSSHSDLMALAAVDSACANGPTTKSDSSTLRHLMVSTFGIAAACGAEIPPDPPVTIDASQIIPGNYSYGGVTITDGVFTSVHKPWSVRISRTQWKGSPALLAVREGPLLTGVHTDSIIVSMKSLTPLHFASWYPTQHPLGSIHADFDSSAVTIVMKGRFDTTATFPYPMQVGELPFGWTESLVVPALPLTSKWHGTLQIALPIHPHAYKLVGKPWESMSLRVVGSQRITVAAGTFDCWKVRVGEPEDRSFLWVGKSNHLVIRSQSIHGSFDDRNDLQRMNSDSR